MGEDQADDCDRRKPRRSTSGLKRSAAALCVGAGSFSDPVALPGLAHFVEHMVFMGSEKYPDENSFDTFVQKSGGSDNASTDCETTVFYFDTQRKHFREGRDRVAGYRINDLTSVFACLHSFRPLCAVFHISFDEARVDAARARGRGQRVRDGTVVRLQPEAADLRRLGQKGTPDD